MFNLKKLEPKFSNTNNNNNIQRKMSMKEDNNYFINFDINISESESYEKYRTVENCSKSIKKDLKKKYHIKLKQKNNKNIKYKLFNDDNYSITTNFSENKKIKKVTFSTVEIIRVIKYKNFNAKNNFSQINIQKNINDMKNFKKKDENICSIF